jgi:hypothetical protein
VTADAGALGLIMFANSRIGLLAKLALVTLVVGHANAQQPPSPPAAESARPADNQDTVFSFDLFNWLGSIPNKRLARAVARPDALSFTHAAATWAVADNWLRNTGWGGRARVNEPYVDDNVNIYIVRRDFLLKNRLANPDYFCPCAYLAGTTTIICVDDALNRAMASIRGTPEEPYPNKELEDIATAIYRSFLTEWFIAHELGHLSLQHNADDLKKSWEYLNTNIGLDAERQADQFYVSRLQHRPQSQMYAFLGLSNAMTRAYAAALRAQYGGAAELKRRGIAAINADTPVTIRYSTGRHPPLLARTVNLFSLLIERYPDMVDTSGYVKRIAGQITFQPAAHGEQPTVSAFCGPLAADSAAAAEPLEILRKYFHLYLLQGEKDWARETLDRIQVLARSASTAADQKVWQAAATIMETEHTWRFDGKAPDWSVVDAAAAGVDTPYLALLRWQTAIAKAFTEQTTSIKDMLALGAGVETNVSELVRNKIIDLGKIDDRFDVVVSYLLLGFVPRVEMDSDSVEFRKKKLDDIFELESLAGLQKETVVSLLDYQARVYRDAPVKRASREPEAVFLGELVDVARAFSWTGREIEFRVSEIEFLEREFPRYHSLIANRQINLASLMPGVGKTNYGIVLLRQADRELTAALATSQSENSKKQLEEQQMRSQNNLGWQLQLDGRFAEALQVLETIRTAREKLRNLGKACEAKADENDRELAAVYQNIADTKLGIGDAKDAAEMAEMVTRCLSSTDLRKRKLDALKTEGIALFFQDRKIEAQEVLKTFVIGMARFVDDNSLPEQTLEAIVSGRRVSIRDMIDVNDTIQKVRR